MTTVTRVGGMRVFTKAWADMTSDSDSDDQQTPKKQPWAQQSQSNLVKSAPAKSSTDSMSAANRAPSLGSIVAAIATSTPEPVSFTTNKQLKFSSWKDLTTPTSVNSAHHKPFRVQPHRIQFADDTADSVSAVIADQTTQSIDSVVARPAHAFDPELDSSRDGLPLLLKQVKVEQKLDSISEQSATRSSSQVQPVARTISLSGHKRKESVLETISLEMTTDVTMQVSDHMDTKQENSTSSTQVAPVATAEVIHRPNVVKKQKTTKTWALPAQQPAAPPAEQETVVPAQPRRQLAVVLRSQKKVSTPTQPSTAAPAASAASKSARAIAEADPVDRAVLEQRLRQRQKQIDLGKETEGYSRYISLKPKRERTLDEPKTPNIHKKCSKRSWDGQVRKWRKQLHAFDDPASINMKDQEDKDDDDKDDEDTSQLDDNSSPSSPTNSQSAE